ncbi:ubiquitin-conjugating enzyme E2 6 [Erysiphe pulchra]|uniref:Ubiquitin-conjugating enzyme E2 6 n=1 Tax=Erysiphe pulchra TaxID=225359 RepID=A0A2S4PSP7_9PEZI|nr:ubiquitin-conjugating enzyme E2 6 [Erysiphe pulchra]
MKSFVWILFAIKNSPDDVPEGKSTSPDSPLCNGGLDPPLEAFLSAPVSRRWHYILTGPRDTPYHNGQYWGTLIFPSNYPFAPPAIRMHTPSGRFQPSARLCLSISDFHPKSFNPAWEVSTILIGLLSFMTSEEMTTGSVSASLSERKWAAARTRWWNSTGGGSWKDNKTIQKGNVKAGDGGSKFRSEWPQLDQENWKWMEQNRIDPITGNQIIETASGSGKNDISSDANSDTNLKVLSVVEKGTQSLGDKRSWFQKNRDESNIQD